ncbi:MAG: integration host factor subunit beta [Verrucomicrobia bacterium]|jgi:nucleoid DNA-binding protein|nr:integration host factor subunit beta [Verrucomicrobiota bacterium]
MTKRDLVVRISQETGLIQQDVFAVIQKTLDYVTDALVDGEHVEFRDFGVFDVCLRKARVGRNPNDPGTPVPIPPHNVVRFKPGKKMKERVADKGVASA